MQVDICVVGAGLVGGSLACHLATKGLQTAVIDQSPLAPMEHPDFDGRAYAIAAGSQQFLKVAGLWDRLPFQPCPIFDIRVSDGHVARRAASKHLHFDHADANSTPFGWMVEARSLRAALNAHMRDLPGLSVFAPTRATIVHDAQGATALLSDGREIRTRLMVAADGRTSPLREMADISKSCLSYRQASIVTAIDHDRPHHNVALEHFVAAGPFAQLPLTGTVEAPNRSAIVWTERSHVARQIMSLDNIAFERELQRRLGIHLGDVRVIGRRWLYPLGAMHAHRYIDKRVVLVGDAAHGIHPIAGQGLNLGFRDAIALTALVEAANVRGHDLGSAVLLRRYQALRRPANLMMLAATHSLDQLFSSDNPFLRTLRDLGLSAVARLPNLKEGFARLAMDI